MLRATLASLLCWAQFQASPTASESSIESLVAQAMTQNCLNPAWLRLLHYRKTPSVGEVRRMGSTSLSEQGRVNPQSEWKPRSADLLAANKEELLGNAQRMTKRGNCLLCNTCCRFPARLVWLVNN